MQTLKPHGCALRLTVCTSLSHLLYVQEVRGTGANLETARLRLAVQGRSVTLVDDTYNANPDSVVAAIRVLAELPGPRLLVLGDMGEVGDHGPAFHREVGTYARRQGIDVLWTAGSACIEASRAFSGGQHFDTVAELLIALPQAPMSASVVVKGSRFMKMEQVVDALMQGQNKNGEAHAA